MRVNDHAFDGQQRRWVLVGMPNAKTFEEITDRHPQPQRDLVKPAGPDAIDAFFTLLQLLMGDAKMFCQRCSRYLKRAAARLDALADRHIGRISQSLGHRATVFASSF